MADKFKSTQLDIQREIEKNPDVRVLKLEGAATPVVQQFQFGKIQRDGEGQYAVTKAKYGPLAATDPDRKAKPKKDSRFRINDLLRDPLSIEQEERRAIEERVREGVAAISKDAKAEAAVAGYQEGLQKGYEEAFRKFREEGKGRLERLDSFLAECERAKEEIYKANEQFLVEMVYRIAKMVLLKELSTDREYVTRLARELVERTGLRDNIRIRVNPEDAQSAAMIKEGLEQALGTMKNLNIEASNQVQRGGCVVETEWNAIDASVETQLNGIHEALLGGTSKAADGGENA